MAQGVFSLLEVRVEQVKNIANGDFASWSEGATYGYVGGGLSKPPGTRFSNIGRLDFFNEVYSNPGANFPTTLYAFSGVVSSSYGYSGGGDSSPDGKTAINLIHRLDLSTETLSLPGKNLPSIRKNLTSASSSSYGYFVGGGSGDDGSLTAINTISRIDFTSETISAAPTNLPATRFDLASVYNDSYGYFGGGAEPTLTATVNRLDFSNETISSPGKNLPSARSLLAGTSSSSYGYFGGGQTPIINTITRLDFSSETISNPGNNLPVVRQESSTVSSDTIGYFVGGAGDPAAPDQSTTIYRLNFSNETTSQSPTFLSDNRRMMAAFSGGQSILRGKGVKTYGYYLGGFNPGSPAHRFYVDRLDFSTETRTALTDLATRRSASAGTSSNYYGYIAGGQTPGTPTAGETSLVRIDFFNEAQRSLPSDLSSGRRYLAATENNSYGYFAGGSTPPGTVVSVVDRIDFSTESISRTTNLPSARDYLTATSSNSYGYFGGGATPTRVNTITRLDFTTETFSDPGKNLPTNIDGTTTVKNSSYGYFGGGFNGTNGINTITRLDFFSETTSDPGKNLSTDKFNMAGTESSSYGYFGGGFTGSVYLSAIDRFNFSTETVSTAPTILSTIGRSDMGSFSNSN